MKGLYLDNNAVQLKELSAPQPAAGEALVKVSMAGICNTDLELIKGYMGFQGVLGHEFVGVVEETDDAAWRGKRVCGEINFGCGGCDFCLRGLSRHCPQRTVLGIVKQNGAFADFVILPVANLHAVPDSVADRHAVFVEPLAAALEITEQVAVAPNHSVVIIGDGKLGLLIAQVLGLGGGDVHLVGKHEKNLRLAAQWGVTSHPVARLPQQKYDLAVEVSGSASGFQTALSLLKPRGTMILKSTYHGELQLNAAPIVIDEITIVGSRCGPFAPALRLLQRKLVAVEAFIDKVYPFEHALPALEHAARRGTLKVLLDFHA